jgi:hypothetical protein
MMILKADKNTEAGVMPTEEGLAAMARYNEELVKAGVMLDGAGLRPSSQGARVLISKGSKPTVIDGPFAETKELIAGYWVIQVKSKEEAIEWAKRAPFDKMSEHQGIATIELRQYWELEDFPEGEAIEQHRELQEKMKK